MPLEIFASGRDDPCWSPQAEDPPIRKHSTSGRPLCETVHAAAANDEPNFQVKDYQPAQWFNWRHELPKALLHQTLTRHQGDPEPKRSFRKHSLDCLSALVTDRAMETWYHSSIA